MSGDQPPSTTAPRKRWVERLSQIFSGEPEDLDDLLDVLREAKENHVLDTDALTMIEGVLQVSQMRVRDIMIPRVQMVVVPKDAELETIFQIFPTYPLEKLEDLADALLDFNAMTDLETWLSDHT